MDLTPGHLKRACTVRGRTTAYMHMLPRKIRLPLTNALCCLGLLPAEEGRWSRTRKSDLLMTKSSCADDSNPLVTSYVLVGTAISLMQQVDVDSRYLQPQRHATQPLSTYPSRALFLESCSGGMC